MFPLERPCPDLMKQVFEQPISKITSHSQFDVLDIMVEINL